MSTPTPSPAISAEARECGRMEFWNYHESDSDKPIGFYVQSSIDSARQQDRAEIERLTKEKEEMQRLYTAEMVPFMERCNQAGDDEHPAVTLSEAAIVVIEKHRETIARLERERDDARWLNERYLADASRLEGELAEAKNRAYVDARAYRDKQWHELEQQLAAQTARVERLRAAMVALSLRSEGMRRLMPPMHHATQTYQDFADAHDAAKAALAKTQEPKA